MSERQAPWRPVPPAVAPARRVMVVAAASTVVAAVAVVAALLVDSPGGRTEGADIDRLRNEVAEARAASDAAIATAVSAKAVAEGAAAQTAQSEEARAADLSDPGDPVTSDAIVCLEAQLEDVRKLAADAVVAAGAQDRAEDPTAAPDASAVQRAAICRRGASGEGLCL
ncbi:MAG: hypothetical protein F4076_09835 [Acidimicrobiaceae bacterium]|nr:hypothetical protein [Acidimicrobiaceae bacterium]MYE75233.1 hypothetical protein [Acidimicrobiaceae bacterium]MYJ42719.1 hypothetical protein [Acidimicrobiaceae bacterium]